MSGAPQFLNLWPTLLMRHVLPGAEQANPLIAKLVGDLDAQSADMTVDYLRADLLSHPHPAIGWLKSCIDRAVADYARAQGIDYPLAYSVQAWANVNRFGDYHNVHNHPHSWLSGTYYVQVPPGDRPEGTRSDLNPNEISFYDPRPQANMTAIRSDGQVDPEHRFLPRPGEILVWPAFLHHMVHVNLSKTPRISISFNVVLKWRDDYLPKG